MKYLCYTAGLFVLAFADTPPTAADINFTINEDTTKAFSVSDFAYADAEDDPLSHIVITTLSTQGTLSTGI